MSINHNLILVEFWSQWHWSQRSHMEHGLNGKQVQCMHLCYFKVRTQSSFSPLIEETLYIADKSVNLKQTRYQWWIYPYKSYHCYWNKTVMFLPVSANQFVYVLFCYEHKMCVLFMMMNKTPPPREDGRIWERRHHIYNRGPFATAPPVEEGRTSNHTGIQW